jgi:glycosyltransferase involved in cell wall biosynthesis
MFDTLLSVILPAYNAEKYISETIDSILSQTFSDFELLICDDCSSDKTWEIIKKIKDSRIRLFRNNKNLGKTLTCNELFNYVKGVYVTVHDADDISEKGRFEKIINHFREHDDVVLIGSNYIEISTKGKLFGYSDLAITDSEIRKRMPPICQFQGPAMVFKKSAVGNDLFRTLFVGYNHEDTDLAYRLLEKGKVYNFPEYLLNYRINPGGLSKKNLNPRKKLMGKVAEHLYNQRITLGSDDFQNNNMGSIEELIYKLEQPYRNDNSLQFRENASFLNYYKLYNEAIGECLRAIKAAPFNLTNYRALGYTLKKMIFSRV